MDVREKLVEIERAAEWFEKRAENTPMPMARKMFELAGEALREKANGVTVQEWISVKDRLPDPFVSVLVQMPGEEPFPTVREGFISNDGIWQSAMYRREPDEVTHWQPMPQPPKGE